VRSPFAACGPEQDVPRPLAPTALHDSGVLGFGEADPEDVSLGLAFGEFGSAGARCHTASIAATETLDERDLRGYGKCMTTSMKVSVTVVIDVDTEAWALAYGVEGAAQIRADVKRYALSQIIDSAAADEGGIRSAEVK
jgi:hypothetical protein